MSSSTLYRLSGVALLTGGLLMVIGLVGALFIIGGSPPGSSSADASLLFQLVFLAIVCGLVLIVAGLPGMYVRQARRTGVVGFIGFGLTLFGVLLDLGLALIAAIIVPWIATAAPQLQNAGPPALFILLYGTFLLLGVGLLVQAIEVTVLSGAKSTLSCEAAPLACSLERSKAA